MFPKLPAILVACLAAGCAQVAPPDDPAVNPTRSNTLDPEELGIGKYVFEKTAPAGKVMVLRRTEDRDGRRTDEEYESISYAHGKTAREVVLVYDSVFFPFHQEKTDTVRVRAQSTTSSYSESRCKSRSTGPGRLTVEITSETKPKYRLTFTCFLEDYAVAKKRVPDLPAMSPTETWTYNALVKVK